MDRPSRLSEVLPVAVRSDAEIALELGRVVAVEAALVAYKSELVMGLAGTSAGRAGSGARAARCRRQLRWPDPGDE